MKQHWKYVTVFGGAIACLLLAFAWIFNALYWRSVTGSWIDSHITAYEEAPIFCIAGAFFFLQGVSRMLGIYPK